MCSAYAELRVRDKKTSTRKENHTFYFNFGDFVIQKRFPVFESRESFATAKKYCILFLFHVLHMTFSPLQI